MMFLARKASRAIANSKILEMMIEYKRNQYYDPKRTPPEEIAQDNMVPSVED
jgi:hypothetical protein